MSAETDKALELARLVLSGKGDPRQWTQHERGLASALLEKEKDLTALAFGANKLRNAFEEKKQENARAETAEVQVIALRELEAVALERQLVAQQKLAELRADLDQERVQHHLRLDALRASRDALREAAQDAVIALEHGRVALMKGAPPNLDHPELDRLESAQLNLRRALESAAHPEAEER